MVQLRITLFFIYICFGLHAQDQKYLDSLKKVIATSQVDTVKVDAMNKFANAYRYNHPDSAKFFAIRSLNAAKKINYQKGMADSYHVQSSAYGNKGLYDSALYFARKALFIREKIKDVAGMSISNNNIGLIYYSLGVYDKAVKHYLISSKMDEQLNDKEGVATSYNNIGLIYFYQNNYSKAYEYYNMALNTYIKLGIKMGMAGCYTNIAGVYYYQKKYNDAVAYYQKGLGLYEELGTDRYVSNCCVNLGEVLADMKQFKEAMAYLKRGNAIDARIGNTDGLCYGLLALAKIQMYVKSYLAAESTLLEAKASAEKMHANKQLSSALEMLAEVYSKTGKYREAYETHTRFTIIQDSLLNFDNNAQITEMTTKYESDRKSKEIELLKKQKEIQKLQQNAEESKNKIVRNSLIGGFIVILILAVLIYNRYQLKQKANLQLQQKNEDIQFQKEKIELQAHELTEKNKEITDSIHYAKRIQLAILPPDDEVERLLPESFVLYKPKDIVSGDFYWLHQKEDKILVAAVDCTGHGVPGALMSVVGSNMLNQIVGEPNMMKPNAVLNALNKNISINLQQRSQNAGLRDGMDISLCALDLKNRTLEFSGAMNSAYIIRNREITEIPANKIAIGTWHEHPDQLYDCHEHALQKDDMLFLFTDGYADQFGGPKGKKFRYKQLLEMLVANSDKSCKQQKELLNDAFEEWRGKLEQVDDVCIIGIRV